MSESLQARAKAAFDALALAGLPDKLKRHSLRHYYLSIWPPITHMAECAERDYPAYPPTVTNLYMHVPFCSGACSFCNYYFQVAEPAALRGRIDAFLGLLRRDIALHMEHARIKANYLYIGGGTPSLIAPESFASFFEWLAAQNILAESILGTVELHPELFRDPGAASAFLDACRKSGIGRVSLGVQELSETLLRASNRRHGTDLYEEAIGLIRSHELTFNLDIMYGLPGQTKDDWERTLRFCGSQRPDSVSVYFLFLNGKSAMSRRVKSGIARLPDYRHVQELHLMAQIFLEESGYFELPGDFFARRPDPDIDPMPTLGERTASLPTGSHTLPLGPGSYGYFDRTQFVNHFSEADWTDALQSGRRPIWRAHRHSAGESFRRDLMFSVKNSLGVNVPLLAETWGEEAVDGVRPIVDLLAGEGLIEIEPAGFSLSRKGRLCAEEIACLFAPPLPPPLSSKAASDHNFSPSYG